MHNIVIKITQFNFTSIIRNFHAPNGKLAMNKLKLLISQINPMEFYRHKAWNMESKAQNIESIMDTMYVQGKSPNQIIRTAKDCAKPPYIHSVDSLSNRRNIAPIYQTIYSINKLDFCNPIIQKQDKEFFSFWKASSHDLSVARFRFCPLKNICPIQNYNTTDRKDVATLVQVKVIIKLKVYIN